MQNHKTASCVARYRVALISAAALVVATFTALTASAAPVSDPESIPSGNGVFHGCYNDTTGALRLIDPAKSQ